MNDPDYSALRRKRCNRCGAVKLENAYNDSNKTKDGLAATCRECVNRRRRELSRGKPKKPIDIVDALKRGLVADVKRLLPQAGEVPLDVLLAVTVQDFHSIKKTRGHEQVVDMLIERGAVASWHFVCEAARGGNQELVDRLVAATRDDNIFMASAIGDVAAVQGFIDRDGSVSGQTADPRVDDSHVHAYRAMTALHYCCMSALGKKDARKRRDLAEIARLLIDSGCPVDGSAEHYGNPGITPLSCLCATGGNELIAELLIPMIVLHESPYLGIALGHFQRHGDGHYEIADRLLEAGADPDYWDGSRTLLQAFANHGDHRAVGWLLQAGARMDARDAFGRTALHHAAERNTGIKVIDLLLDYDADHQLEDGLGQKAVDIARQNDKTKVAERLAGLG